MLGVMQLRDFTYARALILARRRNDQVKPAPPAAPIGRAASGNPSPRAVGLAVAAGIIVGGGGGFTLDIAAIVVLGLALITLLFKAGRRFGRVSEALAESAETGPVMSAYSSPPSGPGFARVIVRMSLVTALAAVFAVAVLDRDGTLNTRLRQFAAAYVGAPSDTATSAGTTQKAPPAYDAVRELTFKKQSNGHFFITADVNGSPVDFLVDSGASHIVLTQDDAQRIGLRPRALRYDGRTQTANGVAAYANVDLRQVRIGQLSVYDVGATVVDSPLSISLLGMSFLSQLDGFEVRGDRLILRY